jgi:hypothetical protein
MFPLIFVHLSLSLICLFSPVYFFLIRLFYVLFRSSSVDPCVFCHVVFFGLVRERPVCALLPSLYLEIKRIK